MNAKVIVSFVLGAAVGSLVTWVSSKSYVQKKANEAVEAVHNTALKEEPKAQKETKSEEITILPEEENSEKKAREDEGKGPEVFVKSNPEQLENELKKKAAEMAREKKDIINYSRIIKEIKYVPAAEESEEYSDYPYLITKEMIPFGEKEDSEGNPYDKITLFYYEDGIIADTDDNIIDDVDDVVGTENLSHFGDFPNKDCIYVRNDRFKEDIEVCMSNLSWEADILRMKPYLRE